VHHHRRHKLIKLSHERYRKNKGNNNNSNNNNNRQQGSNNGNNNNNNGAANNNDNNNSPQANNSELFNAQTKSNNNKRPIVCWDCGKPGLKSGHDGCPNPGSKKYKPVVNNQNKQKGNNNKEANNISSNPIMQIKNQYEKLYLELSEKVNKVEDSVAAYSSTIQPLVRQSEFAIREDSLDSLLNHDEDFDSKEGNNVVAEHEIILTRLRRKKICFQIQN
jgi:hypothetical protein